MLCVLAYAWPWIQPYELAMQHEYALNEGSILAMYMVYVHTCLSHSGMSICTHVHAEALYVMCTDTGEYRMPSLVMEDREEQHLLIMEDRLDNAVGPPQHAYFCGVEYERSQQLVALRKRKQRSQGTVEANRARREQEKVQKKKARCGESSQARYKLCSLFMFDSTVVVLEL